MMAVTSGPWWLGANAHGEWGSSRGNGLCILKNDAFFRGMFFCAGAFHRSTKKSENKSLRPTAGVTQGPDWAGRPGLATPLKQSPRWGAHRRARQGPRFTTRQYVASPPITRTPTCSRIRPSRGVETVARKVGRGRKQRESCLLSPQIRPLPSALCHSRRPCLEGSRTRRSATTPRLRW